MDQGQKGGYKLKREIRRAIQNPEDYNLFPHILKLIDGATNVEVLSVGSKFSIVFKIIVSESASDFVDENEDTVTVFALKLCFVRPSNVALEEPVLPENILIKHSISLSSFEAEKTIQRGIWVNSVENGYAMICPILTDGTILTDADARHVIDTLFAQEDPYKNYALSWLTNGYQLGVYTMELIHPGLTTLVKSKRRLPCMPSICASILVLAMKHGTVHLDLHANNVLVNDETRESKLIDFGQVITLDMLRSKSVDFWTDAPKKKKLQTIIDLFSKLTSSNLTTPDETMDALFKIANVELAYNACEGKIVQSRTAEERKVGDFVVLEHIRRYYEIADKYNMGDAILTEFNKIIRSGVQQTPVKIGVAPRRMIETVRPGKKRGALDFGDDLFGKQVPLNKRTQLAVMNQTPTDSETIVDQTPLDSEMLVESETVVDETPYGGTHTKRHRKTRRKTRRNKRKHNKRRSRRHH
jgi:serine/threonine protein kinase